jgi:hypothetical protein
MKRKLFIGVNLFIFITMVISVISALLVGSRGVRLDGITTEYWQQIVTFTILSNIFLGVVALISAIRALRHQKPLTTLYLVAATAACVTLVTVLFYLAPSRALQGKNYFDMLLEQMFFCHFLNPLLGIITFIFLLDGPAPGRRAWLLATLPVIIYAAPYVLFVVILKIWPDFYDLTFGGRYYLTLLVASLFISMTFLIAFLLSFFHKKIQHK